MTEVTPGRAPPACWWSGERAGYSSSACRCCLAGRRCGGDEHGTDDDLLPERLDADDDESVLQRGRDEQADNAAENGPVPAEQAGAADDDTGDHGQVRGALPADRGRLEERQVEPAGESGQQAGQGVDQDQVTVDVQAGPPAGLGV